MRFGAPGRTTRFPRDGWVKIAGMDVRSALDRLRGYETVIDTMHCGLVAEDLDGKIVFVNERLLSWLSYSREEVVGQHVEMLVPPELRDLLQEDMKAASEGDLRTRILAIRRRDSTTFPVVAIPQRFFDEHGNHDGHSIPRTAAALA